ncbi:hypothetical protein NDU88_002396 [Pleurodeles waltl]|uniref:Uncharacterized protein n=1 Tax=Pleurodeles waltl TaxID=8319 RepID=A0AAV7NGD6_PLEWA|nr:hypothetical protein NDU88_002396 [Pleurodeles waltl]
MRLLVVAGRMDLVVGEVVWPRPPKARVKQGGGRGKRVLAALSSKERAGSGGEGSGHPRVRGAAGTGIKSEGGDGPQGISSGRPGRHEGGGAGWE